MAVFSHATYILLPTTISLVICIYLLHLQPFAVHSSVPLQWDSEYVSAALSVDVHTYFGRFGKVKMFRTSVPSSAACMSNLTSNMTLSFSEVKALSGQPGIPLTSISAGIVSGVKIVLTVQLQGYDTDR